MNEYVKQFEKRAKEIISKMSLLEKISQLRHHSKALPKHKISEYNWWNECLHGVARAGVATVFPQAIAMAATFDESLMYKVGDIVSTEARAKHHEALRRNSHKIYEGLTFWSPNINIYRDPRWGRGQETYGECPVLTAKLGNAFIKGLQGHDEKYLKVSACAKHYAVHSGPEADRHTFNAVVSKKDMAETYLYAFEKAVKDAKVESVMGAYNRVNGEACCASETLLVHVLRGKWNFKGHVVSDCGGIGDIIYNHKIERNPIKGVALAINNGLDLECGTYYSTLALSSLFKQVTKETIDKSLCRLLVTRMKLGMFDDDCKYSQISYSENAKQENEDYAITVAEKSIVMLKNDGILPITKKNSIALVGKNATNEIAHLGNYSGTPTSFFTILDALKSELGENLSYSEGIGLVGYTKGGEKAYADAIDCVRGKDIAILCVGLDSSLEGEAGDAGAGKDGIIGEQGDRASLSLPDIQIKLIEDIAKLGKKIILLNYSGGAINFSQVLGKVNAILQVWYPGAKGGNAIANILYGRVSPSGRLPVTFYANDSDLPDFSDYAMKNRTYRYFKGKPLYPFGYGLSYTTFEYGKPSLVGDIASDAIISVDIKNVGNYSGDEVAQLYIKYPQTTINQPNIKLVDCKRVTIGKGETESLTFKVSENELSGYNENGDKMLFAGDYELFVGGGQPQFADCVKIVLNVQKEKMLEKSVFDK